MVPLHPEPPAEKMLRIAGVLAVVALGLSSAHTKGRLKDGSFLRLAEGQNVSLTLKSPSRSR